MDQVRLAFESLDELYKTIKAFSQSAPRTNHYRAPIIDHFHPDAYSQRIVAGLSRFLSHVQSERDYVEGVSKSHLTSYVLVSTCNKITESQWCKVAQMVKEVLMTDLLDS